MKKVTFVLLIVTMVFFGMTVVAQAATLDEAKALGIKAAEFIKANGKDKGVAELANPKGQFVKGEMYVTVQDTKGIVVANCMNASLVGQNHTELKDPSGKLFVKEFIDIAKTKGGGWSSYVWVNPATKKVQAKKAWIQKVEGTDMYTLSGLFQ